MPLDRRQAASEINADFLNASLHQRPRRSRRPREAAAGRRCGAWPRLPARTRTPWRDVRRTCGDAASGNEGRHVARPPFAAPAPDKPESDLGLPCTDSQAGASNERLTGTGECRVAWYCIQDFEVEFTEASRLETAVATTAGSGVESVSSGLPCPDGIVSNAGTA